MRLLILLLSLGGVIIFAIQNREPVALVFFGSPIALNLPVAGWMILSMVAGIVTSLVIQLLNFQRGYPPNQRSSTNFAPRQPTPPPPKQTNREEPYQAQSFTATTPASDWESQRQDDWNLEEPPQSTVLKDFERRLAEDERSVEQQPKPQTSSQSGSVYSYGYRKAEDEVKKTAPDKRDDSVQTDQPTSQTDKDKVYDADYRVVTPPYRQNVTPPSEDEEDWV